jgi:hypothetical protein
MAVSGTISTTQFNTLKVVDQAFRRCRLSAQKITAEMQSYAQDSLHLLLSELANGKPPSWCIERLVLPMYEGQPVVTLPTGTVEVLNLNYRTTQEATGTTTVSATEYKVDFAGDLTNAATIVTVGCKWLGAAVALTFETSDDDVTWVQVGSQTTTAASGEWTWTDIAQPLPRQYFRITSADPQVLEEVYLGTMPQEIPLGVLNRDGYVAQSNKSFTGRPATFWYQRDLPQPVVNLWPAPNAAAEHAQLILWRHRHIMDVGTLAQDIEVPQRWLEAIVASLAEKVASETPEVDVQLIPMLGQKAALAMQLARDGDNDGSPIYIQPSIGCYTR